MSVPFSKFNLFVDDLCKGVMNLSSDVIKVMLTNTAPVATNHVYSDISANEVASGNGYTTGGKSSASAFTWSLSNTTGTETLGATSATWTSDTADMAAFRYVVYYDSTPATKTLIGWYDYGSSVTLHGANGDTFTVTPAGNVLATIT